MMMPFLYSTQAPAYPVLVIANQSHVEDDDYDDNDDDYIEHDCLPSSIPVSSRTMPIPMTALSHFVNPDRHAHPPAPVHNDEQGTFRLRMSVEGFQPNELNVSIRQGRLIVRGKNVVQAQTQSYEPLTTNSIANENDDIEPDFIAKEFKRTFVIPPNADIRKAHAQFYPEQQLLVVEVPFQNLTISSQTSINRTHIRPIDVFFTIVYILLMDRALHITYEQYTLNEYQATNTPSQY